MSQQGIFSIAPDANTGQPNTGQPNTGQPNTGQSNQGNAAPGNVSPFTVMGGQGGETVQPSPFTAVSDSPFQQVRSEESVDESARGGIPQRRPEGQPPMGGSTQDQEGGQPAAENEPVFQAVEDRSAKESSGGAFKMNGFSEQSNRVMEAAPVVPVQEASPFVAASAERPNYEAAKAGLEPQQDFAAVPARYAAESRPVPVQHVPVAEPDRQPEPVYSPQTEAQPASAVSRSSPGYQQLELRAIFGVDHILGVNEILQRARTLPGIRNVAVVGNQEAAALSNFRQAMQSMGFGDSKELKLHAGGGTVDFISEDDSTIAVLLEGSYAPGVQETLIIAAREIGKLV